MWNYSVFRNKCFITYLNGLKQLQNRGYDSAGISLIYENEYKLYKHVSSQHFNAIQQLENTFYPISQNGIGHTRSNTWPQNI